MQLYGPSLRKSVPNPFSTITILDRIHNIRPLSAIQLNFSGKISSCMMWNRLLALLTLMKKKLQMNNGSAKALQSRLRQISAQDLGLQTKQTSFSRHVSSSDEKE